ncbi:MAG TPA: MotA/TolQ/ExbB proton channel family protein [Phycisphaerae bacterium]|nr:MotA/TolQ/ExbB proton channel family protein [Phycisphaerae bacterium]HRW52100.1 MotA/TolQ/ExbB proton channel family protein [Phycisphaerae bacterium]
MMNAFESVLILAAPTKPVAIQSVWDFVVKGGPMMIPIILCSLFALGVIVERVVSLRTGVVIPAGFLEGLHAIMRDPKRARKEALAYCSDTESPLGGILAAGVKRLNEPVAVLEKHVQDAGERAIAVLRKNLRVLTVVASVCPLMGLLGTIFGMIEAFQTVAASGEALGKTELLAEGIYQAMITTAAGLLVAIPVVIAYHYLSARIDALVGEMDRMTLDFLEEHAYAPRSGAIGSTNGDSITGRDGGNGAASAEAPARDLAIGVVGELEAS